MKRATLVVMAAGIGSRFGGGIKQLEPVGPHGEIIMDYSIYDAMEAGFDRVVFVIRRDLEQDFKEIIGNRIARKVEVGYAYQEVSEIPDAYRERFRDRTKPWGTGQAILCCKELVDTPFLVINADDFYGKEAYQVAFKELTREQPTRDNGKLSLSMVGFVLGNTLSNHGAVTRGICRVDEDQMLVEIEETSGIIKTETGAAVMGDDDSRKVALDVPVSMNMWGLPVAIFDVLDKGFEEFVAHTKAEDLKAEYLLPTIVEQLLRERKVEVKVLHSKDKWFGVTYKEDKDAVVASIRDLVGAGVYPEELYA